MNTRISKTPKTGSPKRPWKGGYVAAAIVVLLFACSTGKDDDNFRADVIGCEEALAHLSDCCPGFDASRVRCQYYYSEGCNGTEDNRVEHPTLDSSESECIRNLECSELVERQICTRAQNDIPFTQNMPTSDGGTSQGPVCP